LVESRASAHSARAAPIRAFIDRLLAGIAVGDVEGSLTLGLSYGPASQARAHRGGVAARVRSPVRLRLLAQGVVRDPAFGCGDRSLLLSRAASVGYRSVSEPDDAERRPVNYGDTPDVDTMLMKSLQKSTAATPAIA